MTPLDCALTIRFNRMITLPRFVINFAGIQAVQEIQEAKAVKSKKVGTRNG